MRKLEDLSLMDDMHVKWQSSRVEEEGVKIVPRDRDTARYIFNSLHDARTAPNYDLYELPNIVPRIPLEIFASSDIEGIPQYINPCEGVELQKVQETLKSMRDLSCFAAVKAMTDENGLVHDDDDYEKHRNAVRAATTDLSALRMFRLLLAGPETMWTDRSPMVDNVRLLRQNPNNAIPTVNNALQRIADVQGDTFEIPTDYARVLGTNTKALLAQVARYSTLSATTKTFDGSDCNNHFGHLAHQIDFILEMIPTVYRLGAEWGSKLDSNTKKLMRRCNGYHNFLTSVRKDGSPDFIKSQIELVAVKMSELLNTTQTDIAEDLLLQQSYHPTMEYKTHEQLVKARIEGFEQRLKKFGLNRQQKAQVAFPDGGNNPEGEAPNAPMQNPSVSNANSMHGSASEGTNTERTTFTHKLADIPPKNESDSDAVVNLITQQRDESVKALLQILSSPESQDKFYTHNMNVVEKSMRVGQIETHLDVFRRMQSILLLQNKALWSDITSDKEPSKNVRDVSRTVTRLLNPDQNVGDFINAINTIKQIPLELKLPLHTTITNGVHSVLRQLINHQHIHIDLYGTDCASKIYADVDGIRHHIGHLPRYDIFGSQVLRVLQCVEDAYFLSDALSAQQNGVCKILQTQLQEVQSMRQDIRTWILELKKHCDPNKWHRTHSNAGTRQSTKHSLALDDGIRSNEKSRQDLLRDVLNDIFGERSSNGSLVSRTGIHQYEDLIQSLGR